VESKEYISQNRVRKLGDVIEKSRFPGLRIVPHFVEASVGMVLQRVAVDGAALEVVWNIRRKSGGREEQCGKYFGYGKLNELMTFALRLLEVFRRHFADELNNPLPLHFFVSILLQILREQA